MLLHLPRTFGTGRGIEYYTQESLKPIEDEARMSFAAIFQKDAVFYAEFDDKPGPEKIEAVTGALVEEYAKLTKEQHPPYKQYCSGSRAVFEITERARLEPFFTSPQFSSADPGIAQFITVQYLLREIHPSTRPVYLSYIMFSAMQFLTAGYAPIQPNSSSANIVILIQFACFVMLVLILLPGFVDGEGSESRCDHCGNKLRVKEIRICPVCEGSKALDPEDIDG